jgi:CHAT domain-containing protein
MLGGRSRSLAGEQATERALKQMDLGDYRILHLAAHAVIDEQRPDRSAVVLAPGADEEDGLLQFREVVNLDLDGQVVILSACRSASGPVIGGDGVMGLAHAFFLAGGRTVVAGLWPLRDDEAALLIREFARELSQGQSVSAALTSAKRAMIWQGAPAAAWAGLVVLGHGDQVPLPGGRSRKIGASTAVLAALIVLSALGVMLALALRRRRAGLGTRS